jgi:hypothetical protein
MARRERIKTILFCMSLFSVLRPASAEASEQEADNIIERYLSDIRHGKAFHWRGDVSALIADFKPVPTAVHALKRELRAGNAFVRENVVTLLNTMAIACHRPAPDKMPIVRDHAIIGALLVEGFLKNDAACQDAFQILHRTCLPADLARYDEVFMRSLHAGSGTCLLLAAKAKTAGAGKLIDRLAQRPDFQQTADVMHLIRTAQAALGNTAVEDTFIAAAIRAAENAPPAPANRFYDVGDARDGAAVTPCLKELGWIGTRRSLQTACQFLRSPLKRYVVNHYERSIRYDALDAIRFNFPDKRVLDDPRTVAEWAAAEQFCEQHLSAIFDGPTPDLPRDRIYPHFWPGRAKREQTSSPGQCAALDFHA